VAVEFAPEKRRGFLGSLPGAGCSLGGMLGTLALLGTSSVLTTEQFLSWGWRMPFVLSLVLVAYGIWLRRSLPETPVFRAAQDEGRVSEHPLREVVRSYPRTLVGIGLLFFSAAGLGYFYVVFMVSYGTTHGGLSRDETFIGLLIAQSTCTVLTAAFGALSDRVDRRVVMLGGVALSIALAFPFFGLIQPGWPEGLWLGMFLGNGVAVAALFGPMGTYAAALLPEGLRYSAMGLARETGNMLGAAVVPLVAVQLAFGSTSTVPLSMLMVLVAVLGGLGFVLAPRPYVRPATEPAPVQAVTRSSPAGDRS
jgi:MHS family shikimate/dehydroshikimate transporter-like MFS transporter